MLRTFATTAALALAAPAFAQDIVQVEADGDMMTVMTRLETAVAEAGATIFARVPHSKGAASVDMALNDAELLIFGNPKLGTPALQDDILAGLYLPLRVLVYTDDDGQTWIAYQDVEDMFDELSIDDDAAYIETMSNVLARFAETASGD